MAVNQKIKDYLINHGIKQKYIVEKTGLSKGMISDIIRGRRKITAEELGLIAKALKVDANIFLQ